MKEALEWLQESEGPALVVIDSAESAGCPADGSDVAPWLQKIVEPFRDAGCTVLVLDHVPKRKEGRPLGPIGSQHKLAKIDGAALFVSGVPWTQKTDGHLVVQHLSIEGCRRLGRGGLETRPVVVGRRSNHW